MQPGYRFQYQVPPKSPGLVDDADVADAPGRQVDGGEHAGEPAADDHHLGVLDDRIAGEPRLGEGVTVELREVALELLVLGEPVGAQPLGTLCLVALAGLVQCFGAGSVGVAHRGSSVSGVARRVRGERGWSKIF